MQGVSKRKEKKQKAVVDVDVSGIPLFLSGSLLAYLFSKELHFPKSWGSKTGNHAVRARVGGKIADIIQIFIHLLHMSSI